PRSPRWVAASRSCSIRSTGAWSSSSSWRRRSCRGSPGPDDLASRPLSVAPRLTGRSVKRVEDPRLLAGRGTYLDDLRLPRLLHVAFVRSPHAHAHVRRVDLEHPRGATGVAAALSRDDRRARVR